VGELAIDQTDIEERDNVTISQNMQDLQSWKKTFEKASINYREYVRIVTLHADDELASAKNEFEAVKKSFEETKEALENVDRQRELFSTHKSTGEKLDYPHFSGASSEDFIKFKDKIVKAFRTNGVAKSEQVEKLRKVLSGFALALVPESTATIEKALETLKNAFGDPRKVLDDRMTKLRAVGDLPPERLANDKPGFRKQEEWYLTIEGLLSEIISLGDRGEDLAYHAFSEQTFNFVLSLFPSDLADKLAEVDGSRKEQLRGVMAKLGTFRMRAQRLGKIYGNKAPPGSEALGKSAILPKKSANVSDSKTAQPGRFFKSAEKYEDCRVCKHLEQEGKTGVFENHLSTYPTGCPMFLQMPISQRRAVAIKCSLCVQCLDPEVVWDQSHRPECKVAKAKIKDWSCMSDKCKVHMWLCNYHYKRFNKDQMEKHKSALQKKGLSLSFISWVLVSNDDGTPASTAQVTPVQSIEEATRKLTRIEQRISNNKNLQVVPPPIGQPMFLFFQVKGKKNGANFFFDDGCSHACFQEGIPGGELNGEIIAKGPFQIGGVGAMKTKANDEWIVSVERTDGTRQLIQGLTVDKVTCDFPMIDVQGAVAEVKRDKPEDKVLQRCKVPKMAGGVTHGLIGIKYRLIHPDPIHTLPSGLTLYKSKLVGQNPGMNAMIGGPHSTFDCLCDQAGGVANMVANFVKGIEMYRSEDWSAPRVPNAPMTVEEVVFAKKLTSSMREVSVLAEYNQLEYVEDKVADAFTVFLDNVEEIVDDIDDCSSSENTPQTNDHLDRGSCEEESAASACVSCNSCGVKYSCEDWIADCLVLTAMEKSETDDKIKKIKRKMQLMESGLDVDYRCIKCRECAQCKKSDHAEKISLREEQEMQLVRESIYLDWDKKKIVCTLPVRGEETDFLTSNKDIAMKVLDQQCKRWHKDENKESILAAFQKLFRTGDTRFMDRLSAEELECFAHKPVQYFIPWLKWDQKEEGWVWRPLPK
jgi:hypothetical protein